MNDAEYYIPPFTLNETNTGSAVGRVTESASDAFSEGDAVVHFSGWRHLAQGPAEAFTKISDISGCQFTAARSECREHDRSTPVSARSEIIDDPP
nr:hypothetical protein [Arthrobacter sp. H41]